MVILTVFGKSNMKDKRWAKPLGSMALEIPASVNNVPSPKLGARATNGVFMNLKKSKYDFGQRVISIVFPTLEKAFQALSSKDTSQAPTGVATRESNKAKGRAGLQLSVSFVDRRFLADAKQKMAEAIPKAFADR